MNTLPLNLKWTNGFVWMPRSASTHSRPSWQRGNLRSSRILALDVPSNSTFTLVLHKGQLWATLEGDAVDYLVQAGQTLYFSTPGKLVLEALEESEFEWKHSRCGR